MVSNICFGITRVCREEEVDDQIRRLFMLEEEYLLPAVKNIIGEDFPEDGHKHDGEVLEKFYRMVSEGTGRSDNTVRVKNKFAQE
ncbi:hypothetical protein SUGI_0055070 [Cryptomeria japonica]|nr:hypothetical protein SUGI_0055070 [Cryptomeria japonica]